jgi:hypothetical protein
MKSPLFLIGFAAILGAACNNTDLVSSTTPIPTGSSIWGTPPPGTPPYKIAYVGDTNCYGNADHDAVYVNDPDDPPGEQDAKICEWDCATDENLVALGIQTNPPNELIEVWDFDNYPYITQYINDLGVPGYPKINTCYDPLPNSL